ncbi:probable ATP-dependent RNA helicase DHX34 isoform X3 [Mytilus trossulus]
MGKDHKHKHKKHKRHHSRDHSDGEESWSVYKKKRKDYHREKKEDERQKSQKSNYTSDREVDKKALSTEQEDKDLERSIKLCEYKHDKNSYSYRRHDKDRLHGEIKDQDNKRSRKGEYDSRTHKSRLSSTDQSPEKSDQRVRRRELDEKKDLNYLQRRKESNSNHDHPETLNEMEFGTKEKHVVESDHEEDREEDRDFTFDFHQYRSDLNRIFFRDDEFIKKPSKAYDDFWSFLLKYQQFQRKKYDREKDKQGIKKHHKTTESTGDLDLPQHYDNRYRISFNIKSKNVEDFLKKGRLVDADVSRDLTKHRVKQFRNILIHYVDFLQKQKFAKLKKIKTDQENLPIFQYKQMIQGMVQRHQVVVVAGDTGCGKSTQTPQYLLEAGFTKIACTQPRRIACISLSKRVGYETLNEYGSDVAYQVRFEKTKTRSTKILFLTEGLLLRQMSEDQHLKQYSVIVIDEVHERHIHTDFLLGVIKCLLKHREDLKLVLMSATINIDLFSGYFDDAPVIKVPGRLYPIELEYKPIKRDDSKAERLDPSPYLKIMQLIDHKFPEKERGDLLIFLSGMSEIMSVVEAAKIYATNTKRWIILPLHSALSVDEQDKVFDISPEGVRKCIVSTNIAETSVTIDGVRFIVDSGKVKEMSFDPKYKMQRLQEFWISRASAEQRKGRAGRTGPGVCYRLYDSPDYDAFQEYATPEIQRVPLDALILQMVSMGLPDARKFPFLEAPDITSIENAIIFLKEQGAMKDDETLTPIGNMLSRLPVDVVIGKMLIMGSIFHMIDAVLSIAAAMSVQSPFTNRAYVDRDAMEARKPLESDHGDPFTLLETFDEWIQVKAEGRGTKKWCKKRGLEEQRFYEMMKLRNQFKELLKDHHLLDKNLEGDKFLTSEERRRQHGDRRRLGVLKKEQRNESKKRKVLKLEDSEFKVSEGEEEDDENEGTDIKDLEFRLSHDLNKLQTISNQSRSFTLKDINLLKIILCSGLYPQVAINDDTNSYKSDSEQSFHTKNKPFLLLHPTSVFASQPELLQPPEPEKQNVGPSDLRGKLSNKHQLLTYVKLLETDKPYLVNTMRVPALQTVTLFSNFLDTSSDCTRLICDGWLEIKFPDAEIAQDILSSVIMLRATWQNLLQLRLQDTFKSFNSEKKINPRARKLEKILAEKLSEFLSSDVLYAVRRVMTAEMKYVYKGPGRVDENSDLPSGLFMSNMKNDIHPVKGGIQINDYLCHNCLIDEDSAAIWGEYTSSMQKHWTCPRCKASLIVTVLERLRHESECQSANINATKEEVKIEIEEEKNIQLNPLRKSYHCDKCDKDYHFTNTEILKHKKSCSGT